VKLTNNEKREILKLIEADKPLPDKYRFMLSSRYEKWKDIAAISGTAGLRHPGVLVFPGWELPNEAAA